MKAKLPIRPVGSFTINLYNSFHDCVDRLPHEGGLLEAELIAKKLVSENTIYHSYSVDRRVASSLTNVWSVNNE